MADSIHLIAVYTKTVMKAWFQYRVDAVLRSLAVFFFEGVNRYHCYLLCPAEIRYIKWMEFVGNALFIQPLVFDIWYYDIVFYRFKGFWLDDKNGRL